MNLVQRRLLLRVSSIIYSNSCCNFQRTYLKYVKCRRVFLNRLFSITTCGTPLEGPDDFSDVESSVDIHAIVGDDPEKVDEMKFLILEIDLLRQSGEVSFPSTITPEQWRELLTIPEAAKRRAYIQYLFIKEKRKLMRKLQSAKKYGNYLKAVEERKEDSKNITTSTPPKYCLSNVTLFYRILPPMINKVLHYRLAQALMFGPQIIIDCSYEPYMNNTEIKHCANQIMHMWSHNRSSAYPFNIIYCNVNEQNKMMSYLSKVMPKLHDADTFFNFTKKNYLDLFPREQLVYLTPHCNEELETYDKSSVYIVGAFVDEQSNEQVSLAKAKRDGLRMAKFPLDKHLNWCQGSKYLPLNQVVSIMTELKDGACWQYALRHVAPRKQTFSFMDDDVLNKKKKNRTKMLSDYIRNHYRKDLIADNIITIKENKKKSRDVNNVDEKLEN